MPLKMTDQAILGLANQASPWDEPVEGAEGGEELARVFAVICIQKAVRGVSIEARGAARTGRHFDVELGVRVPWEFCCCENAGRARSCRPGPDLERNISAQDEAHFQVGETDGRERSCGSAA